jgi:hypothetical protein
VLNGGKVLAKIATGIQSVPAFPLPRVAATDDIYVPGVQRSPSGTGPQSYSLLTIHGTKVVHRMSLEHYPTGVIVHGNSAYIVSGSFFDHYRSGALVSSASVDSGWSAAVARNGTAYLSTGDDDIAVVQGGTLQVPPGVAIISGSDLASETLYPQNIPTGLALRPANGEVLVGTFNGADALAIHGSKITPAGHLRFAGVVVMSNAHFYAGTGDTEDDEGIWSVQTAG